MKFQSLLSLVFVFSLMASVQAQETKENQKVIVVKKKDENGKITVEKKEAEEKGEKKVYIIKKVDENGKVTEQRAEGEEAEELLKSISPDDIEMINVEIDKSEKRVIITKKSNSDTKVSKSNEHGKVTVDRKEANGKGEKKVVIIKKVDENGKVTEQRAEGEEAEELLKSISPDDIEMVNVEKGKSEDRIIIVKKSSSTSKASKSDNKGQNKEIEIKSEIVDGKSKERYKIIIKDGDNEKVLEWDGDGEMPKELADELSHTKIKKTKKGDNMHIMIESDDDMDMNMEKEIHIMHKDKEKGEKANDNKVSLGVMIEDTDNGVVVSEIVSGSAAEIAGLKRGDVILKVSNTYIFTSNGLLSALNPYNPNDKVKITYIREGKEKSATATMKARK